MLLPDMPNARPRHWLDDNPPLEVYSERMGDWEAFLARVFEIDREAVLQSNESMHALVDTFLATAATYGYKDTAGHYFLKMVALECNPDDDTWPPDIVSDSDVHRALDDYFAFESDTLYARGIVLSHILDELSMYRFQT